MVSIITPNYNCGRFVAETIESVLAQTYTNWEMIIVDDCSTDDSLQTINKYAERDDRIKVLVNEKNSGAAISRNLALSMAKGKWIAFLDSDDLWLPEKLEKQVAFMEKNSYSFTYHEYTEIDEDDNSLGVYVSGIDRVSKMEMYCCCWPGCLTVMYDREAIGLVQIKSLKVNNDTAMWLKVVKKAPCYLLKENLAKYRRRTKSTTPPSLAKRIWAHYPLFRIGCSMNPAVATFFTIANVFGNGYKKLKYVRSI